MSKKRKNKNKKNKPHEASSESKPASIRADEPLDTDEERLSVRGKKTIGGGIVLLVVGFYILTLTDPHGRNWASTLSPILILGAYAVIGIGIFLGDPEEGEGGNAEEKTVKPASESSQQTS